MTFRSFEPRDREKLERLLSEESPYITRQSGYAYWMLERYLHPFFCVAEESGEIIGFTCGLPSRERSCLFIWQLQTAEARQREGIGLRLAQKLTQTAREAGLTALEFTINRKNKRSLRLADSLAQELGSALIPLHIEEMDKFGDILFRIKLG